MSSPGPTPSPSSPHAEPLVSVILPTHNRADLLPRAIRSVLGQTYRNLELFVVDDASTDDTPAVVRGIADPRLRYLRLEKNSRAAAARNVGIKASRGELLAFQDDDDEWLPQKIERQVAAMLEAPAEVGLVLSGFKRIDEWGERTFSGEQFLRQVDFKSAFWERDYSLISTPGWLLRRSVLDRIGGFDERFKSLDDWELSVRIFDACAVRQIDEVLWLQHRRPMGQSMATNDRLYFTDFPVLIEKYGHRWAPALIARYCARLGHMHAQAGQFEALRWFARAVRYEPLSAKAWVLLALSCAGPRAVTSAMRVGRKLQGGVAHV